MRELLYKTMFILSIVSSFAVMLYGTGGPSMPFSPSTPTFNNPFSSQSITLYPAADGSQAPVNIRGYIPPTFITNPHPPYGCKFGEPVINTSDPSTGTWWGCLDQPDQEESYATIGFSAGPSNWYTMSTILDSAPNNGHSYLLTNITVNYQCHGDGDYPVFAFIPPANLSAGASPYVSALQYMFSFTPVLSPTYSSTLSLLYGNGTPLFLTANYLLPFLNGQPYGGSTSGISNLSVVQMVISNPYGICTTTGPSNRGPYGNFQAYAYGINVNGLKTGDMSFSGMHLNDFFGGSGANLLIYPSHGAGATSDLLQISYVSVTLTYQVDSGCSLISNADIFTNVANAVGYIGCEIQAGINFLIDLAHGGINFFLYLVDWASFIIQTLGNYLSILAWLYGIPGLPSPLQALVDGVVSLWIAIISIEIYHAIDPFGS
jgi:hypothetical protein